MCTWERVGMGSPAWRSQAQGRRQVGLLSQWSAADPGTFQATLRPQPPTWSKPLRETLQISSQDSTSPCQHSPGPFEELQLKELVVFPCPSPHGSCISSPQPLLSL